MSHTVSIRLDEKVLANLDRLAKITNRSRAWLMGHAVEQYVQHEAWQAEAIQKTLLKLQRGEASFVGHESITEWLQSWGSETEGKPPVCE